MSAHIADEDAVTITVNLPLPVDVAATLTRAIGAIWPNTTMDMSSYSSRMTYRVTAADRLADDLDLEQVRQERIAMREELEGIITRIGAGEVGGIPAEEYLVYVAALAEAFLDEHGAANYVEQILSTPDGRRLTVTTHGAHGQTPVEHRNDARAEAARMHRLEARLRARIDDLERELAVANGSA